MLRRARGTLAYARRLPGQRRVPFLPEERVRELRDARVREMVAHAAQTVPYYRELFRTEGIDPRELRTGVDLDRLPLLDKALARTEPERLHSSTVDPAESLDLRTTGSTGMPFTVRHDRASLLENIAFSERERSVETAFIGRNFRYDALDFGFRTTITTPREVRAFYDAACYRPLRPRHHPLAVEEPVERVVETINRLRPAVVRGYGTYLEMLFRVVAARGLELRPPKVIVYTADGMTEEGRSFIESTFGVPVLSQYSAVEVFKIGFFCEERRAFHLHEDLCRLTIVGPDGHRLPDGSSGEVVVSNLVNRGMVLLNYPLGDVARILPGRCDCGRTSRLLTALEGRVSEIVHLPDGSFVHPLALWAALKNVEGIVRYQLVQHEPERFELKLVTVDSETYERASPRIAADLSTALRGAAVEPTYHEALEQGRGGKFRPVVPLTAVR
jgi:phenylacetate-CoA ligase